MCHHFVRAHQARISDCRLCARSPAARWRRARRTQLNCRHKSLLREAFRPANGNQAQVSGVNSTLEGETTTCQKPAHPSHALARTLERDWSNSAINSNTRSDPSRCGRRSLGRYAESSPDFRCRGGVAVFRDGMEMFGVLDLAPSSTGADPRLESETRTTSDFGWHELSGYESSCVTILRLGEISVLF